MHWLLWGMEGEGKGLDYVGGHAWCADAEYVQAVKLLLLL